MTDLTRYAYDARSGAYVGEVEAHDDPMNPGSYLEPAFSTTRAGERRQPDRWRCSRPGHGPSSRITVARPGSRVRSPCWSTFSGIRRRRT